MKVRVEVYEVKKTGYIEVELEIYDASAIPTALKMARSKFKSYKKKSNKEVSHILLPVPLESDPESEWFKETVVKNMKVFNEVSGV